MKLLVFDPLRLITSQLLLTLKESGYIIEQTEDLHDSCSLANSYGYNLVLSSLDKATIQILKKLRAKSINTPLIAVTVEGDSNFRSDVLNAGADDVLSMPISGTELSARMGAVIRRAQGHSSSEIKVGPLYLDLKRSLATVNGKTLTVTKKEYSILELLALRKGSILSKETFLNHMYTGLDEPEIKIVDVFICRLRKKIAQLGGGDNFIQTVWGRGYLINDLELSQAENARETG